MGLGLGSRCPGGRANVQHSDESQVSRMQNNISRRVILFVPVAAQPLLTGRLLQYGDESISHSIWLGRCHPRRTTSIVLPAVVAYKRMHSLYSSQSPPARHCTAAM